MLRAVIFIDCDFCHEAHWKPEVIDYLSSDSTFHDCEEAALEDGWCHALMEDTGQYRIMCCNCQMELQQQRLPCPEDEDIAF